MASFEDLAFDWSSLCQECTECWTESELLVCTLLAPSHQSFWPYQCPYKVSALTASRYICASDGITYVTICEFKSAQIQNPELKIVHYGSCNDQIDTPKILSLPRKYHLFYPFEELQTSQTANIRENLKRKPKRKRPKPTPKPTRTPKTKPKVSVEIYSDEDSDEVIRINEIID